MTNAMKCSEKQVSGPSFKMVVNVLHALRLLTLTPSLLEDFADHSLALAIANSD